MPPVSELPATLKMFPPVTVTGRNPLLLMETLLLMIVTLFAMAGRGAIMEILPLGMPEKSIVPPPELLLMVVTAHPSDPPTPWSPLVLVTVTAMGPAHNLPERKRIKSPPKREKNRGVVGGELKRHLAWD